MARNSIPCHIATPATIRLTVITKARFILTAKYICQIIDEKRHIMRLFALILEKGLFMLRQLRLSAE